MNRLYYEEYSSLNDLIRKASKFTKYKSLVNKIGQTWKVLSKTLPKGECIYCMSNDPAPIMRRQWEIEDFLNSNKEDVFVLSIPWQEFSPGRETFLITATEGVVENETTEEVTCYLHSIVIPRFKGGKIVKL
jgi:hypothetical protein